MHSLLLLSGLLCDGTVWGDVPELLADAADVRIVFFRGFASISAMAEHVLSVAPGRFAVAGHSMGGRVALEVLLDTGVHPVREGEAESRGELVRLARAKGMAALAAAWLPPMMGASAVRIAAVMPALVEMVKRSTPEAFSAQINALLHRPDAEPVLSSIKVPALLLSGTNDNWSSLAQHREMQRSVAHAALVGIEDAGHMAPIEQPEAVAGALREWLAAINEPV
jgi:pimeloyl-ACP methyl ester carboxylesterase